MKMLFEAMQAALAKEKFSGLLVTNQQDFLMLDRSEIEGYATPLSEYLWFVRDCSTWLARLYVHEDESQNVKTALRVHEDNASWPIFHLTARGCKEIDAAKACELTDRLDYRIHGDAVLHYGKVIARMDIERETSRGASPVHVRFRSEIGLSLEEMSALRCIARGETRKRFGNMAFLGSMVLDDASLVQKIQERKRDVELVLG